MKPCNQKIVLATSSKFNSFKQCKKQQQQQQQILIAKMQTDITARFVTWSSLERIA